MKREILFRGKTEKGEWVYGYHAKFRNYKNKVYSAIIQKDEETDEGYMEDLYPVIPETVGQYTGIKDKNGKKIFECDILRVNNSTKSGVVEIKDFEIRCDIHGVKHRLEYETVYEVIGNIFDKESDNGD